MDSEEQQETDDYDEMLEEVGSFLDRIETLYEAARSLDSRDDPHGVRDFRQTDDIDALFGLIQEEAEGLSSHLSGWHEIEDVSTEEDIEDIDIQDFVGN